MSARGRKRAEAPRTAPADRLAAIRAALGDRWPVAAGPGYLLVCGDCLDVMAAMPDGCVDHMIGDPPYSEHTHSRTWTAKTIGRPTVYEGIDFAHLTTEQAFAVAAAAARLASRWFGAFTDCEGISLWRESVIAAGLDYVRSCAWVKPDATPQFTGDRPASGFEVYVVAHPKGRKRWNGGGKRNVYTHCRPPGGAPHPTTKPIDLMVEIVEDFTDPGDLVLDAFAGSGTTGVACLRLGRLFIGIERDAAYFEIACRRMRGDEAKPRAEQPSLFDARTA